MDNLSYLSSEEYDEDDDEDDEDQEEDDEETDESTSQSEEEEEDSSSQQTTTLYASNSDNLEEVCLGSECLTLPQGLSENEAIFNEFFSQDTWENVLSVQQREHLKKFLPRFPEDEEREQEKTISNLFSRSNFKFGNPLNKLYTYLHNGYLRPDIAKVRNLMKRARFREYRYWHRKYCYGNMQSLLVSRRKLMKAALSTSPDVAPKVERIMQAPVQSQVEQRARRRYFEELMKVRKAQGESSQSSEDENYPEGPPPRLSKKQKKQLSTMETCLSPDLPPIPSTLTSTASPFQLESQVTCTYNPYEITEDSYKNLLMKHKKRRIMGEEHAELYVKGISLQDVAQRSQTSRRTPNRQSQSDSSHPKTKKKIKVEPGSTPPPAVLSFSMDKHNSPSICSEDSCSISFSEVPDATSDVDTLQWGSNASIAHRRKSNSWQEVLQSPKEEKAVLQSSAHDIKEELIEEDEEELPPLVLSQQLLHQHTQQMHQQLQQIQTKHNLQVTPPSNKVVQQLIQKPSVQITKPLQQIQQAVHQKPVQQPQSIVQQIQKPIKQIQKSVQEFQIPAQQQQQYLLQTPQMKIIQQSADRPDEKEKVLEMQKVVPGPVTKAQQVTVTTTVVTQTTPSLQPVSTVNIATQVTANSVHENNMNRTVKSEETSAPALLINDCKLDLELTQETHVCFLSLVRDVICSTPDQRMSLPALEQKLRAWQESPISPLNDWYALAPSWVSLLPSAVNFLSGDFPAETQPEDFVPYLEYKPHMQAYQWIGAGRDSDHHLTPLCTHWLERRNEVPSVPVREEDPVEEPGLNSPPPARFPTTWQVRKAEGAERDTFHQQEKRRYENPHRAFTYRMHGYESIVGPVKGACALGSGLTKPRGHTLLVPDRPNYVTILSLVRDAVARLPNGEGSRSDICELLRDSQYLVSGAEENYLQSVVGGALDRLHFEIDTCVKYDAKRKIWVYLHRNRTEEEFEKLHQQQSVQTKTKRVAQPRRPAANRSRGKDKEVKPIQVVTTSLNNILTPGRLPETTSLPVSSPTQPTPVAPVKASPVASTVPRTFTLASGLQNLQVATSSGIQTIQVSGSHSVVGGTSLLTTSAGQAVKLTAATGKKAASNIATLTSTGISQQAMAAARLMVSSGGTMTKAATTITTAQQTSTQSMQGKQNQTGTMLLHAPGPTTTSSPTSVVLHSVTTQACNTVASTSTTISKTLLAGVNATQLVGMSQTSQQQQPTSEIQQQKLVQKQVQRQQQMQKKRQLQQIQLQLQQQQQKQIQQQKQQLLEQQLQQLQEQQGITTTGTATLATGMKLLSAQAAVKSLAASGTNLQGAQAIFIKHGSMASISLPSASTVSSVTTCSPNVTTEVSLQQSGITATTPSGALLMSKAAAAALQASAVQGGAALVMGSGVQASNCTTTAANIMTSRPHAALVTTAGGKPMVAKVLTNAQGQLISMEHLLAHQKQQLAAGAVRVSGAKSTQQASLIQIPGTGGVPQFAMVASSGLVGPRLLQAAAQQLSQQQQQQVNQQVVAQSKQLTATTGLRMVNQAGSSTTASTTGGLNVATIGGQPVILASKAQGTMAGQNVFLASSPGGGPAVVLASPTGLRTSHGGTLLLQSSSAQQIMLPHGFQGGTLNLKTLQGLQGIRVIPLSQAAAAAAVSPNTSFPKGRQQVFARIISPPSRGSTPASATPPSSSTEGVASTGTDSIQ